MSYTPYAGVRAWDATEAVSIHGATAALAASIDGGLIPTFATTAARDAAAASLIAGGRKGMLCYVTNQGYYTWNGAAWGRLQIKGITQDWGTFDGVVDSNGIAVVTHGLGAAPTCVTVTMTGDAPAFAPWSAWQKPVVVGVTSTTANVKMFDGRTAAASVVSAGERTIFYWLASL